MIMLLIAALAGSQMLRTGIIDAASPSHGVEGCPTYDPGVISFQVRPGQNVAEIVRRHGDRLSALTQTFSPPFDPIAKEVGLDRYYLLKVPSGHERSKADEYFRDSRVEVAQLESNCVSDLSRQGPST